MAVCSPARPVAVDSSSLILLQKSRMLNELLHHYRVWVSSAVYEEISLPDKEGAKQLAELFAGRVGFIEENLLPGGMDRGEGETIAFYRQGIVDFIMVDDKKAAGFCRRSRIPFINSLLLPRVLYEANLLPTESADQAFSRLRRLGYYSDTVIDRAMKLSSSELERFFPHEIRGGFSNVSCS